MPQLQGKVETRIASLTKAIEQWGEAAIVSRIHPRFATHAQDNARWSTTDPPLAQQPEALRHILTPDPHWPWFGWDWDQQELRIIAALAKDKPLLTVFENGWDVHTLNCCDLFNIPYPTDKLNVHKGPANEEWRHKHGWEGKDDLRRVFAKRFVYRLNYGGDPRTAGDIPGARTLGLTPARLVAASRAFLAAHPALAAWRRKTEAETRRTKCVRSFAGRRRMLHASGPEIVRAAFDYPMQAGGAEMFNLTVIAFKQRWGAKVLFKYGMHDSQTWGVHHSIWTQETLMEMADLVERTWDINGQGIVIPGSFFTRLPGEEKEEWKTGSRKNTTVSRTVGVVRARRGQQHKL